MNTTDLELTVSVSQDARLTATVRDLVRYAAQVAGCDQQAAEIFGRRVEDVVRATMFDGAGHGMLPVTVRCRAHSVEVEVDGRTLTLDVQC